MQFFRLVLMLSLAAACGSAQSLVTNNTIGSTSPYTITAPASGNVLLGCFANRNSTNTTITSVSQTNVTWTFVGRVNSQSSNSVEIWYGVASASAGTSVTITWAAGTTTLIHQISEWSGVNTSSPVDAALISNTVTGVSSISSGNYTTTNANDVMISCVQGTGGTNPSTPTNSFTQLQVGNAGSGGSSRNFGTAYRVVASTGTYSTGWTVQTTNQSMVLVGFKQAASAIPNKVYSYLRSVSRAAYWTFAAISLGWDSRSVIARVREMLAQLKAAVAEALCRLAEMELGRELLLV